MYEDGTPLAGIDVSRALAGRSVMLLPCLNPDGIELAAHGAGAGPCAAVTDRLCDKDYRGWQANARGVDLRVAFDAGWTPSGSGAPSGCPGARPMTEPECRAAANFCAAFEIRQVFVFANGEREIAYRFTEAAPRARLIAQVLAGSCAAKVSERPGAAGFKDWFIHRFDRPAFEVGIGTAKNTDALYGAMVEMMVLALLI
ncbi:MAG: M14 family zinc carboxypeptidase [Oscillospiraceae bacterium]